MELLGDKAEESMHQLVMGKSGLKTLRGKCQAYTEIVDAVAGAKSTLESYQNSKYRKN